MLTRTQKKEQVSVTVEDIKKSKNLIFADFTGVGVEKLRELKKQLRESGAKFKVVKKRLLDIALKRSGIEFDPLQFEGQVGTVFVPDEITSVASMFYKFGKEAKTFKVLGSYDLESKSFLTDKEFTIIAKLPSREVMLAQVMGGITGPIRAFMSIVQQLSERNDEKAVKKERAVDESPKEESEENKKEEETVEEKADEASGASEAKS